MATHKTISAVSEKNILNNNARKMEKRNSFYSWSVCIWTQRKHIMVAGCHVISQDYEIKWSCDFMDRNPSSKLPYCQV